MAVITPFANAGPFNVLRNATAQANTGQTDWVPVPSWAIYATVFLNVTAVAGTTPEITPSFLLIDPVTLDDTYTVQFHSNFTSVPITGVAQSVVFIGPGVSPSDDVALAATGDSFGSINIPLPPMIGCKLLFDRTSADETYTYSYSIWFRG